MMMERYDGNERHRAYEPKKALMLMGPEHGALAEQLGLELALQGVTAHMESDVLAGAGLVNQGGYDVIITGPGYDSLADHVNSLPSGRRTQLIAISDNGVQADAKFSSGAEVVDYVRSGWLNEHYKANEPAQSYKAETDSDQMGAAELEILMMRAVPR